MCAVYILESRSPFYSCIKYWICIFTIWNRKILTLFFFFKQSSVCNYLSLQMSWQERTFCPNVWDHNWQLVDDQWIPEWKSPLFLPVRNLRPRERKWRAQLFFKAIFLAELGHRNISTYISAYISTHNPISFKKNTGVLKWMTASSLLLKGM